MIELGKYAGTVLAYARESAGISTEETVTPDYHSLFIADYILKNNVSWKELNKRGWIFGKNYKSGNISYTLRAPTVGSGRSAEKGYGSYE